MEALVETNFVKFFLLTFSIGFVNNLGYVMVSTGAQILADQFHYDNLMPLVTFMLVGFDMFMQCANVRWFLHIPHIIRCLIVTTMGVSAYVLMSICSAATSDWGFFVGLIAAVMMGLAQCWGEAVMLGFLKAFPSELVGGWSSGTGFAGVGGTLLWVAYRAGKVPTFIVYLSVLPLFVLYLGSLFYLNSVRKRFTAPKKDKEITDVDSELIMSDAPITQEVVTEATGNAAFSIKMIRLAIKKVWWLAGNLGFVYFLEYCINTGFADRASLRHKGSDFFSKNSFIILSLCYQVGVFFSRSSLKLFKVERVWIMTLLQLVNFGVWWAEAMHIFLGVWGEFVWMLWVGCLGGACYVNVAYLILHSDRLAQQYKEPGLNFSLLCNNVGCMLAAAFSLLLDNTMIKE